MAITFDPTTADVGTVEKINPADLIIDPNVRTEIHLDKSFVSSIRVLGFKQYPVGYRDEYGKVHVTIGQRRVSAALEIGWPVIPVVLKSKTAAEGDRAEEHRILEQLAENDQRMALAESDRVASYKQLALLGVSEDQIARKTNAPRQRVKTALTVAGSQVATEALEATPITLDQAAVIAEFEHDPEAVDLLLQTAAETPDRLPHHAQRIRDQRAFEKAKTDLEDKYRDAGWEILEKRPQWDDTTFLNVDALFRADDPDETRLTEETAAALEGRAVFVGEPRWHNRDKGVIAEAWFFVRGWREQGLATHMSVKAPAGQLSDGEKAARKAERQVNSDIRSATTVRQQWIKDTLLQNTAHTVSAAAARLTTAALLAADTAASDNRVYAIAADFLGLAYETVKGSYTNPARDAVLKHFGKLPAGSPHIPKVALAVALARTESVISDPQWKAARSAATSVSYYRQLAEWGYTLSEIEQRFVDEAAD